VKDYLRPVVSFSGREAKSPFEEAHPRGWLFLWKKGDDLPILAWRHRLGGGVLISRKKYRDHFAKDSAGGEEA